MQISVEEFDKLNENYQNLSSQIDRLATFIMENIEGEPSRSEGAIDCAIRLLGNQKPKRIDYHMDLNYFKNILSDYDRLMELDAKFKIVTRTSIEELTANVLAGTAKIEYDCSKMTIDQLMQHAINRGNEK